MADKPNRYCPVCNKHYHVCNSCRDRGTWRSICDTPQHYQVYMTVIPYVRGEIDRATARMYLENIGCTEDEVASFIPEICAIIKEITKEEPKRRTAKTVKKPKISGDDPVDELDGELHG